MIGKKRAYALLLMNARFVRLLSQYYTQFRHIKNLGKIAKKKAIKRFPSKFEKIKPFIDYIYLTTRKESIKKKIRELQMKYSGLLIYDINFEKDILKTNKWSLIRENKRKLKLSRRYDYLTVINLVDEALRWFMNKDVKEKILDP